SHYRDDALEMLQHAIDYDDLRTEFLLPDIITDVVTMLQDRSESLVDSATKFLALAAKDVASLRCTPEGDKWPGDITFVKLLEVALRFGTLFALFLSDIDSCPTESIRKEIFDPVIFATL
ncbi:13532_t:CDS:2, partial [Acaulospora colombiana]